MSVIAVASAGAVEERAMARIEESLAAAFGVATRRMPPLADPFYAYDESRNQFSSTLVLREVLGRRPADAAKILVVADVDMFIPMLSFVYGQAQLDGPAAVVSVSRLRQEFYGLPANVPLFLVRVGKEALHEMGHCFGLTHCHDPLCTMTLSTNIQQLDRKEDRFCDGCAALVRDAVASVGEIK